MDGDWDEVSASRHGRPSRRLVQTAWPFHIDVDLQCDSDMSALLGRPGAIPATGRACAANASHDDDL